MGRITMDSEDWPLVRVVFDGAVDDEEFQVYVTQHADLLARGEPYVILFDARRAGIPSATQRQLLASFTRTHKDDIARLCKRSVFVIDNPVVRGALTAILWLQPLPNPYDVVATDESAERILAFDRRLLAP